MGFRNISLLVHAKDKTSRRANKQGILLLSYCVVSSIPVGVHRVIEGLFTGGGGGYTLGSYPGEEDSEFMTPSEGKYCRQQPTNSQLTKYIVHTCQGGNSEQCHHCHHSTVRVCGENVGTGGGSIV